MAGDFAGVSGASRRHGDDAYRAALPKRANAAALRARRHRQRRRAISELRPRSLAHRDDIS